MGAFADLFSHLETDDRYNRLLNYVKETGNAHVPATYVEDDGCRLGAWVSKQHGMRKNGKLDPRRAELMKELPGWGVSSGRRTNRTVLEL